MRSPLICGNHHGATQTFETTDEHPFWSVDAGGWVAAGSLQVGDRFQANDGSLHVLTDTRHEPHPDGMPVFNFEVEDHHSYFVSAHGSRGPPLLVHNADCGPESASRHGDFHGPWKAYPDSQPWGEYLREKVGPAPEGAFNEPHGHHVLMKKGRGRRAQALVQEDQDILRRRAGVDPIGGTENLVWAELRAKGIHKTARVAEIVTELRLLDAQNAQPHAFIDVLTKYGRIASQAK